MQGIFWQAEELLAFQEGLCSVHHIVGTDIHAAMYQVSYLSVCPSLAICLSVVSMYIQTEATTCLPSDNVPCSTHVRLLLSYLPLSATPPPPQPQIPRTVQLLALWTCSSTYVSSCTTVLLDISKSGWKLGDPLYLNVQHKTGRLSWLPFMRAVQWLGCLGPQQLNEKLLQSSMQPIWTAQG